MTKNIRWFNEIGMQDVAIVGGKNASLGEMITHLTSAGVKVPNGFATTADAYHHFLEQGDLTKRIREVSERIDVDDIDQLASAGKQIRQWIIDTPFNPEFIKNISAAYAQLLKESNEPISVAVRSSATAEDLPDASFAGQQETFLNIHGLENVIHAIKLVFASLYNDRAIAYRVHHGFAHHHVGISAGIQRMARSDRGASGVMFSIDTESGFDQVILINAAYGLGETVVQGIVNPDEFYVYKRGIQEGRDAILRRVLGSKEIKMIFNDDARAHERVKTINVDENDRLLFSINTNDVQKLAEYALKIEEHYQRPMDIEWAKDGVDDEIYILQARPETVKSQDERQTIVRYRLHGKSEILATGRAIGQKIGQGSAKVLNDISEMSKVKPGDVLVTDMTDPDWEPIMKRASAIVTNRGGRTCHAAIIARELGIPAVVGCKDATSNIRDGQAITVSCAEGDTGNVYSDLLKFTIDKINLDEMPEISFKIMLNVGNPERAFAFQALPNVGVGLARLEFIISQMIGIHPNAVLNFSKLPAHLQNTIHQKIKCYGDPVEFYVQRLQEGIASIAAAFYPKPVIVRLSDFKTNEYANLLGGENYEPHEENPMLGFRGAARYVDPSFKACFELECRALKYVREKMGLNNVEVMIPFVRTVNQAEQVVNLLAENGLKRGENGLRIIMMCEIPSNAILAEEFLQFFDGFSIGSNDLTQLTLGLDRDSGIIAELFDERDPAVKVLLSRAIQACKKHGKYIGICGQGPSDYPDLAYWLMSEGIDSVSLNPDTVVDTWLYLANQSSTAES